MIKFSLRELQREIGETCTTTHPVEHNGTCTVTNSVEHNGKHNEMCTVTNSVEHNEMCNEMRDGACCKMRSGAYAVVRNARVVMDEEYVEVDEKICVNGKVLFITTGDSLVVLPDFFNGVPIAYTEESIYLFCDKGDALDRGYALVYCNGRSTLKRIKYLCHGNSLIDLEDILVESIRGIVRGHSKVSVGFSGGVDSLICGILLIKYFNVEVYFINTCFSKDGEYVSRDREASLTAYAQILKRYPGKYTYVENNIPREEIVKHHKKILSVSGGVTMDFNLSSVHYFTALCSAAKGSSLLLTGSGADELFLGYQRHSEVSLEEAPSVVLKEVEAFHRSNLHRDALSARMGSAQISSPFLCHEVFSYCVTRPSPGKRNLFSVAQKVLPEWSPRRKLAAQYGSGISSVVRSIKCRCISLCKQNNCLSLQCS
ncbi:hypothetical protein NEFER03_0598 [Nematocida sp. LUAm3]|nr:hypothetical protein NEFER03_0598 [Nematocida sp. LUAm3]KAI5175565.1 hypothetical protein NEFER02_1471 [Nematocida sp. LUAm2]KAI5178405.1 hypothetical protein NEFER01_1552 [Nematocida sp. LUAm1]